jgi:predicted ATP-dependent protease
MVPELKSTALRKHIDPKHFGIKSTEEVEKLKGIIGQQRAVRALKFGLSIKGQGYNIYVSGPPGIGKMTSIQSFLEEIASKEETPSDWCYVNNFHDNYIPEAIELPPGRGKELKEDMRHLVQKVQQELPKIFESDEYSTHRNEILSGLKNEQEQLSQKINKKARDAGFHLQSTPMGIMLIPIKDGKQLSDEDFQSMSQEEKDKYRQKQQEIQADMKSVMKKVRQLERSAQERTRELDRQITLNAVGGIIDDLKEKYKEFRDVISYLEEVQKDITDHADVFKKPSGDGQKGGGMFPYNIQQQMQEEMITKRYEVNLIIDNSKLKGAPVIMEFNPTYNNLIGRIEKQMQMGALSTDFTMIKSGSLLDANGGYIVISVEDLLKNIHSYDALKRTLKASKVQIEELTERLGFLTTKSLRPQPVPLKVKVLLVGPPLFFYMLYEYDHDFPELFKVKADFDIRMKMQDENITNFLGFLSTYSQKENLKSLSAEAAGRLMEHAARMVEDQDRISTQFGVLGDVIRESHYWAEQNNNKLIESEDIEKALEEKIFRS